MQQESEDDEYEPERDAERRIIEKREKPDKKKKESH